MRTNVTGIMFTNTLGILIIYCLTGTLVLPATAFSPNPVTVNNSAGFQAAAQYLLQGLDTSVDPCQDFYKFTCNKYIKNNPEGSLVFGKLQNEVFEKIATQVSSISSSSSLTEQIFARGYQSCILNHNNPKKDLSHQINNQILSQLGGIPMLTPGWKAPSWDTLWQTLGLWESQYGVPSIFRAVVKVDQKNNTRHALYINQINVDKDLFVNIENLARLEDYRKSTIDFVQRYNHLIGSPVSDVSIDTAVTNSMKFQNSLALAMVPNELLRNYEQQYNPYNLSSLSSSYRNIRWKSYLTGLLKDVDKNFHQDKYIVVQPSYLSVVDSMIEGQRIDQRIIADYVGIQMLANFEEFLGPEFREMKKKMDRYSTKSHKPQSFYTTDAFTCVIFMFENMPFGAGYIYVAQNKERDTIALDVTRQAELVIDSFINMTHSLSWLDQYSMQHVVDKRNNMVMNVGWPYWFNFTNTSYMDNTFHRHYHDIMNIDINDFFQMKNALSRSLKITKNLGLLEQAPDRRSFGDSPADVNAWYNPLLNSITFSLALLNPPMYRHDFPQSFNYGAQGSASGHELVHGFDDSGIQFGPTGELSDCTWDRCGWMDTNGTLGFINMAQCVVSQYSENCCPLKTGNVRCANGINTQGENIADLGGTQAAYKAYRKYIEVDRHGIEEGRLPGLEQFTPNQIFWIAHGFAWCSTQTDAQIENDMLNEEHSPNQCRVNQVVRDIPEFGKDFNCRVSTPMYPRDDERCKVWTDAPLV